MRALPHARHPGDQHPATAGPHEVVRADEGRHPAGDLAHRREQWERAVRAPHGLVGDRGVARGEERLGAGARSGEVEIGEEHLSPPRAEEWVLPGGRFFHLQHHVRGGPDLVCLRDDRRTRGNEVIVGDRGAGAGGMLDEHLVTRGGQLAYARWGDRHTELTVHDLPRDADDHAGSRGPVGRPRGRLRRVRSVRVCTSSYLVTPHPPM